MHLANVMWLKENSKSNEETVMFMIEWEFFVQWINLTLVWFEQRAAQFFFSLEKNEGTG